MLLVDGHNSHYTQGFLEYARNHNIHVLCYPAHATHVYQGLDIAVFSVLKRYWAEEREKWEREKGEKVNKGNFWRYMVLHMYAHSLAKSSAQHSVKQGSGRMIPVLSLPI